MADRIIYKNHCTPQEQLAFSGGSRYYLDSDCGRKLTGDCESKSTSIGAPVTGEFPATISLSSVKFIHVKNTDTSGSDYLLVNIGSMGAVIKLSAGESFSSDVGEDETDSTTVVVTAGSGTPSFEYIKGA
tara:strand:- start:1908 stop:2297 length:390 start_codon:yes stop_codon:yes gene_type:complete